MSLTGPSRRITVAPPKESPKPVERPARERETERPKEPARG